MLPRCRCHPNVALDTKRVLTKRVLQDVQDDRSVQQSDVAPDVALDTKRVLTKRVLQDVQDDRGVQQSDVAPDVPLDTKRVITKRVLQDDQDDCSEFPVLEALRYNKHGNLEWTSLEMVQPNTIYLLIRKTGWLNIFKREWLHAFLIKS